MASPNISFDEIRSSIRKPGKYFEFNLKLAVRTLPANLQRTVIIAPKIESGLLGVHSPVTIFSDAEAALYAGRGSIAHQMARAAIKANRYLDLTMILVNDAKGGVAATGSVAIDGTASSSGSVTLGIGFDYVTVALATGDDGPAVAAALAEEIFNKPDLPVTARADKAELILTAKNKGTFGNHIRLSSSTTGKTGVSLQLTPMSNGAVDPDPQPALDVIFNAGHHVLTFPWIDKPSLIKIRDHLEGVSGALEQRGAIAAYGITSTLATATTLASQINDGRQSLAFLPGTVSYPWELGAAYAAICAFEEDPARPLNTLELKGIAAPEEADILGRNEQENLLNNGVTPIEYLAGRVQIVRAITTYTRDPQDVPDISLFDLTTIRTLDYVRKACRERIALRFPREKLSEKTPPKVRSELLDVLYKLEELEIVECVEANKDGLIVERDSQDPNRLDAKIPCDVVNGLHVFAGRIDLLL